jgi:hypothetical protein
VYTYGNIDRCSTSNSLSVSEGHDGEMMMMKEKKTKKKIFIFLLFDQVASQILVKPVTLTSKKQNTRHKSVYCKTLTTKQSHS